MYAMYGSYRHPENEVNLERFDIHARFSPRGLRYSTVARAHCGIVFAESTQAAIASRISELMTAYSQDGFNWGLFHDDGTPTRYQLLETDPAQITGVRVLQRSWPSGGPVEYATQRSHSVTIESELADEYSNILDYHETLRFVGNTGAEFETVTLATGSPVQFITAQQTPMRIVQSGYSLGSQVYVLPFGPLYPDYEHHSLRMLNLGTPKFRGRVYQFFPCQWSYTFELPFYTDGTPTLR